MTTNSGYGFLPEELKENPHISPTGLMTFMKTPLHFKAYKERKLKQTPAMREGQLIHMAVFEPDKFESEFCCQPVEIEGALVTIEDIKERLKDLGLKVSGRKNELIERLLEAQPEAPIYDRLVEQLRDGRELIPPGQYDKIMNIRDACYRHPQVKEMLKEGQAEVAGHWQHPSGVWINMKSDFITNNGFIFDLKKVKSAEPDKFSRQIYYDRLYIQAALYMDGWSKILGREMIGFAFICVEDEAPHVVQPYATDFGTLEFARQMISSQLERFKECFFSDNWIGYSDKIESIAIPSWAWEKE